jgi:SAM-dependent methyltransferase
VEEGGRVLDVAAGAGGQTLAAARRVGSDGSVLATDISSNILEFAAAEARGAGLANVAVHVVDGEELDVEPASFDAAISRLGFMYFPNLGGALDGIRATLRPAGRVAAIVFSTPDRNPFFSIPVSICRRVAQLGPPAPGQPGPFSLGAPGVLEEKLASAGFGDVDARTLETPIRLSSSAECVRFERESFGALHQMLAGVSEADREAAWAEIEQELGQFDGPEGFVGPCELLVAAATA